MKNQLNGVEKLSSTEQDCENREILSLDVLEKAEKQTFAGTNQKSKIKKLPGFFLLALVKKIF